jgi:hypothetical protein
MGESTQGGGHPFEPVRTVADLNTLDANEILEGYRSAERGDPEPGPNRGRAYWHGWRNRMIDMHELPMDDAARKLVADFIAHDKAKKRAAGGESDG